MSTTQEYGVNRRRSVVLAGGLLVAVVLLGVAQARLDAVVSAQTVQAPVFWPTP